MRSTIRLISLSKTTCSERLLSVSGTRGSCQSGKLTKAIGWLAIKLITYQGRSFESDSCNPEENIGFIFFDKILNCELT